MAETTNSPSLPSTADPIPYVPVSWMAVAAIGVSGAFAVTLLTLGLVAFTSKKPLLEGWLLVPPVIAIVLSFAARRVIRNSEGTRTGESLANSAWWIALVLGLCYVAYWAAFDFAISRDARGELKKWTDQIGKGTDDDLDAAFLRTVAPGKRQGVAPTDKYLLGTQFRDERLMFRNCDLLKIARRNKGELDFTPGAVTWSYKPGAIDCVLQGTVKCPEGTFPIVVPLKGVEGVTSAEGSGGRQWQIVQPPGGGFIDQGRATRTPYGWLVAFLELDGGRVGRDFVAHLGVGPTGHPYVYRAFVAPGGDPAWMSVAASRDPNWTLISHLAFAVPARAILGDGGYAEYMDKEFFKREGGAEPDATLKGQFFKSWNTQGLRPAGDKLKDATGNPIDKEDVISITDTMIEVRVPVEIPILGKVEVARGRVVVVCTDPALLAELKQLKSSANSAPGTNSPLEELQRRKVAWRVVRVESDLVPISTVPQGRPGGPGGPGGPDGTGHGGGGPG